MRHSPLHDTQITTSNTSPEKLDHISLSLADNYDIITLSETWLKSSNDSSQLCLPGFQSPFRKDRINDQGFGGVLAWVNVRLAAKRRADLEIIGLEAMWLEIRAHNNKFLLCTVYRPPDSGLIFWDYFQESINLAKECDIKYMIITGDLNADPATNDGQRLQTFSQNNHLVIHINKPTRVTANTSKILDQFLSNIPDFMKKVTVAPPVSTNDHATIGLDLLFRAKKKKAYQRVMWNFKDANFDSFRARLKLADFSFCDQVTDIDDACYKWSDTFMKIAKETIPWKNVTVRPNDKPWYNGALRKLCRRKDRKHKRAKILNTAVSWAAFREARNTYVNAVKEAKSMFENSNYSYLVNEGKEKPKKWWTILKSLLGQTSDTIIPPIEVDNEIITDDKAKANAFNTFFTNVSSLDDSNATLPNDIPNTEYQLNNIFITEEDVSDQIKVLDTNKAYGHDGISPKLLKEACSEISLSLCKLFNASLQLSRFPQIWKKANVIPLFKKDQPSELGNYRPVSLLCSPSKIFEKVVFKYLFNYFKENFLLSIWQSGFLPGRSTVSQLTELYHKFCEAVANGKEIRVVFLDISKAFDRVWHAGLIYKLRKAGIRGKLLNWFIDYLKDRQQRVILNGQFSDWKFTKAGVPQGAVLGPLLFLVFIDDIVHIIQNCQIRLFADDTCLFITVDNRAEAAEMINLDLANIEDWSREWLVNFSAPKTKSLIISNKHYTHEHPRLFLHNQEIKEVSQHKHLGVTLSSNLRWNAHLDDIVSKCTKKLDMMRALKFKLDRKSLEIIFFSFILPVIDYADVIYAGTYDSDLCKLDRIQVDAMRIVTGATEKSNINLLFTETDWQRFDSRRKSHVLCLMYKIVNGLAPSYLCDILQSINSLQTGYNLRREGNIRVPFARTESYKRSFFPHGIQLWNSTDVNLRNLPSITEFKLKFKPDISPSKTILYYGERWASIHHARLRLGCSKLNSHLCYNLHVIPSPECSCGAAVEDVAHFFSTAQISINKG